MTNIGCRIRANFPRPERALIEQFRDLPVANIDDCMNRTACIHSGIRPMNKAHALGPAFTVKVPEGDNLMFHKAMDMAEPGDIIVIDAGGMTTRAIFGELMVNYLIARKIGGIMVDGSVRDYDALSHMDFPVYARGITPDGPYKNGPGEINSTISFGGIVVHPGDIVVGDADGVVFIRPDEAAELAEKVRALHAFEKKLMADIVGKTSYVRPWVDEKLAAIGAEYVD